MRYHIAHSVRGRLRLRVPAPWLRTRQGAVESRLRSLAGVRTVSGNTLTGSLRIDYDPFRLIEQSLVDELKHLDAHLSGPPPARRRGAPSAVVGTKTPLLHVIGATSALAAACLPAPPALAAGLVLAVGLPSLLRAGIALGRRRLNRVGLDTAVVRIVQAIEATADEKSEIQAFAERLADRDVGRTLGLAALGTGLARSIDAGIAILVSDYGVAARVGIPTAIVSSIGQAFRQDILIKGPRVLENLARVDTVVFDKTGTLTLGAPRVTRIARYRSLSEEAIIRRVAAAERPFRHPVARAVARLAAERGIEAPTATATVEQVGLGVEVQIDGARVLIGSRRLMESHELVLRAAAADEAAAHAIGGSPLFVAIDGRLVAMLVLQDQLRDDAPEAVQALRARRMRNVILLSGDHAEPSRIIAESLGLRHHYADLLPEDKARLIGELKAEGRVVAMVGDGVNDALALDEAHVGIAVPGGAEVATEAADVVLLSGGLERVVRALDLARDSMDGVRRTLRIAARANLLVVGLASFGFARPVVSILLTHGTTVAAAMLNARATTGRTL